MSTLDSVYYTMIASNLISKYIETGKFDSEGAILIDLSKIDTPMADVLLFLSGAAEAPTYIIDESYCYYSLLQEAIKLKGGGKHDLK